MPSDVKWNWLDPKTVELYNTDRQQREQETMQAMMEAQARADMESELQGWTQAEEERNRDDRYAISDKVPRVTPMQDRRNQRKQLRRFDKYIKAGGKNLAGGFQELVESGAAWMDESGDVYTAMPQRQGGDEMTERLLGAAREWGRMQGMLSELYRQGANKSQLSQAMQEMMSQYQGR